MDDNPESAYLENQSITCQNESIEYKKKMDQSSPESSKTNIDNCESAINNLLQRLPDLDNCFHIHGKIGEGTFSNVYLASLKGHNSTKRFAIKHLIPTCHPKRMKYELDCLNRIGGTDNVVSCDMTMRQADCVVFIMPYLQHQKFSEYVFEMSKEEMRLYMRNLFLALKRVHSFNIIHRDIKPSNFLYNREIKRFLLVDFGLAQKINENEENSKIKPLITKTTVSKRKREEDDVENVEKPLTKRLALQTLPNDMINKQNVRTSASLRYSRQPLSIQQQNHLNTIVSDKSIESYKRQPLMTNSSNVMDNNVQKVVNNKQAFQSLMPQKSIAIDSGASFVRVQNSQVQPGLLFPKPSAPVRRKDCQCNGKPQVCNICLTRKAQYAPRAGTPGFRPPEVLLKYPYQTTAVDMWAAGVIMLCILSGCYPFFRSPDDITALSELITVFGSSPIVALAKKLGRNVICNERRKPLNLRLLCENLRRRKTDGSKVQSGLPLCEECHQMTSPEYGCLCNSKSKLDLSTSHFPSSAFDLLTKLLDVDPDTRISAEEALQHPFITDSD